MQTAIFVIGERGSGKSSVIRALTGCGRIQDHAWHVISPAGRRIEAFVILSALQEDKDTKKISPKSLLNRFARIYGVNPSKYELLICPLELTVTGRLHQFDEYLDAFIAAGIDVRVAVIRTSWDAVTAVIAPVQTYVARRTPPLQSVVLDISTTDEHSEARRVRDNLYPA